MRKVSALFCAVAAFCTANPVHAQLDVSQNVIKELNELRMLFASGGYLNLPSDGPLGPLSVPPPAAGSATEALDIALSQDPARLADEARWNKAAADAEVHPDKILASFSGAAGRDLSSENLAILRKMIRLAMVDFAGSTSATKKAYARPRPFMINGQKSCTPDWEPLLRHDGSYPSGHSAIGWGVALILSELFPEKSGAILARGQEFGESRLICNVHWNSDILLGRMLATEAFFRMKASQDFRADLDAARLELSQ